MRFWENLLEHSRKFWIDVKDYPLPAASIYNLIVLIYAAVGAEVTTHIFEGHAKPNYFQIKMLLLVCQH